MAKDRNFRFPGELCTFAEERMQKEHRRGSLNSYLEEILYNFFNGVLIDWERERPRLELEMLREELGSKKVYAVGPAKAIIERDEGKRKAS